MYKLGYRFINDDDTINVINWCAEHGYDIYDVGEDEQGRTIFEIQNKREPSATEMARKEYMRLTTWFDTTYAYKEQKYRRLIALNKTDDDGGDCTQKLQALYAEAEQIRERIQQLEKATVKGGGTK